MAQMASDLGGPGLVVLLSSFTDYTVLGSVQACGILEAFQLVDLASVVGRSTQLARF